jgi:HEAT repeat protein
VSKPDPVQRALERIGELRHVAATDESIKELRQFLHNRSNLVVAKAAKLAGEMGARALLPDLVASFRRLMTDPAKLDKHCAGLTEIAMALYQLDCDDAGPCLAGLRHVQMEGSFGPPIDAAAKLRGLCAQGLLRTRHPNAVDEVLPLLADREPESRIGVVRALSTNGGNAGVLLLKFKVLTGDPEAEVMGECFAGLLAAAPERSVDFVGRYVDSVDEAVAESAILALGESRQERAFELLKDKWQRTAGGSLKPVLLVAMARSRLEPAIDYLLSIAGEASPKIAAQTIEALAAYRSNERVRASLQKLVSQRNHPALSQAFALHFGT